MCKKIKKAALVRVFKTICKENGCCVSKIMKIIKIEILFKQYKICKINK